MGFECSVRKVSEIGEEDVGRGLLVTRSPNLHG